MNINHHTPQLCRVVTMNHLTTTGYEGWWIWITTPQLWMVMKMKHHTTTLKGGENESPHTTTMKGGENESIGTTTLKGGEYESPHLSYGGWWIWITTTQLWRVVLHFFGNILNLPFFKFSSSKVMRRPPSLGSASGRVYASRICRRILELDTQFRFHLQIFFILFSPA